MIKRKTILPEAVSSLMAASLGDDWQRVAVVGAGAVGGYFGGLLARAGAPVTMIGRPTFVEEVNQGGLLLDTLRFREVVHVWASNDLAEARGADIVLFCVKTTDTLFTARVLAPFLGPDTIVLSLQNGVENVAEIRKFATGLVLPAAVYLAASVPEPGHVKHTGRGDLVLGPDSPVVQQLAALFHRAGVPVKITAKVGEVLWEKLICNCALNALSALCQRTYGQIGEDTESWTVAQAVIKEAMQVARAKGIIPRNMDDEVMAIATVHNLTRQISGAYSSTAHDLRRRKLTEIDSLNGFIVRKGRELGISVPVNETLFSLVKFAERHHSAESLD